MVKTNPKFIHLLYVPTTFCNFSCKYCYLGSQTDKNTLKKDNLDAATTLKFSLKKLKDNNIIPYNLSLHGGEVTTLKQETLENLFSIIIEHYSKNNRILKENNFNKKFPHIKTNLYNFNSIIHLLQKYNVSISASIDLPLSLHKRYRVTKNGSSSLETVTNNLKLLSKYPYNKKISSTIYYQHFKTIREVINDIWYINNKIGFNMNNFNFMFGFESQLNAKKTKDSISITNPLSQDLQVDFFNKMKREFSNTELEMGLNNHWFEEFSPAYCTNSLNCGERFMLLQGDGSIYSCVRGQGIKEFYYGNIFTDDVEEILTKAKSRIISIHQTVGFSNRCNKCSYLYLCKTGCPFVKLQKKTNYSYTCKLQKSIYKSNSQQYKSISNKDERDYISDKYKLKIHPYLIAKKVKEMNNMEMNKSMILPNDIYENKNQILEIIKEDTVLGKLYSHNSITIEIDGDKKYLISQILKKDREIYNLHKDNKIFIHIKKIFFKANCKELCTNSLYLQMLNSENIVYGDEKRSKQQHLFTYEIYFNQLEESRLLGNNYVMFDLQKLLSYNKKLLLPNIINNLFITTKELRNYHYKKQKNNGFYHIQALNLPFQNIEFFWNN